MRTQPKLRSGNPLEKGVASMLSPYAFKRAKTSAAVPAINQLGEDPSIMSLTKQNFMVKHPKGGSKGRTVQITRDPSLQVACSCRGFEFIGISCRHVYRVLTQDNVHTLSFQIAGGMKLSRLPFSICHLDFRSTLVPRVSAP